MDETAVTNERLIVAKTNPLDDEAALDAKNDVPRSPWAQTVHQEVRNCSDHVCSVGSIIEIGAD